MLVIRSHPELSEVIRSHPESSGDIWSYLESSGVIRSQPETSGVIRSHPESSGVIRSLRESSGVIGSHPEASGAVRSYPKQKRKNTPDESGQLRRLRLRSTPADTGRFRLPTVLGGTREFRFVLTKVAIGLESRERSSEHTTSTHATLR